MILESGHAVYDNTLSLFDYVCHCILKNIIKKKKIGSTCESDQNYLVAQTKIVTHFVNESCG